MRGDVFSHKSASRNSATLSYCYTANNNGMRTYPYIVLHNRIIGDALVLLSNAVAAAQRYTMKQGDIATDFSAFADHQSPTMGNTKSPLYIRSPRQIDGCGMRRHTVAYFKKWQCQAQKTRCLE